MTYNRILSIGIMFLFGSPCGGTVGTHPAGAYSEVPQGVPYATSHPCHPSAVPKGVPGCARERPHSANRTAGSCGSCILRRRSGIIDRGGMAVNGKIFQLNSGVPNIVWLTCLCLCGAWRSGAQSRSSLGDEELADLLVIPRAPRVRAMRPLFGLKICKKRHRRRHLRRGRRALLAVRHLAGLPKLSRISACNSRPLVRRVRVCHAKRVFPPRITAHCQARTSGVKSHSNVISNSWNSCFS